MRICLLAAVVWMAALSVQAGELDLLKQQVEILTETVKDLQNEVRQLKAEKQAWTTPSAAGVAGEQTDPSGAMAGAPLHASILDPAPAEWSPADPIRVIGNNQAYMNISFDGLFAAAGSSAADLENIETGGHDPIQRGFTVQNVEMVLEGAVDPYFRGQGNIIFQTTRDGETKVELEEAFLQTTSLPCNLEIKAGQYFTAFGRLNQFHPHVWDFADQPLVNGRFLGPDGMRNPGAQISYLIPAPWYSNLMVSVLNGSGETAFSFRNRGDDNMFFGRPTLDRNIRGPGDLLYVPRWENSVDLDDEQTVLLGVSAALGPNDTGARERSDLYGVDLLYKWKSPTAKRGFPFVKWQTEAMARHFQAGSAEFDDDGDGVPDRALPSEGLCDWGAYSQVLWGFHEGWVAGFRVDYLDNADSEFTPAVGREDRWRLSPNLTWYPTEFSKLRLQYNRDEIQPGLGLNGRSVDTVILQFEFLIGSHGAHKF